MFGPPARDFQSAGLQHVGSTAAGLSGVQVLRAPPRALTDQEVDVAALSSMFICQNEEGHYSETRTLKSHAGQAEKRTNDVFELL